MPRNTLEDIRMEKVLLDEVRELAIELCLGGDIEQRLQCIREAMLWDNDEIANYLLNALPESHQKYYLRNTELYNAMFRTALRDEDNYLRGW
jgi:hypothetical protein